MANTYKILNTIGDKFTPQAKDILESTGSVDYLTPTQNEMAEIADKYDIFLVGLGLKIDREVIEKASNLKIVATATTGLDHIDIECAKEKKIEIISLRGENEFLDTITGTSELAFGLLINLIRQVDNSFESVKRYEWERENFRGHNIYGKTIGIVGLGRLGKWMARYGRSFGAKVIAHDPQQEQSVFDDLCVGRASFDELLTQSDYISIHVHLNDETENMFDKTAFSKIKKGAYLINTSRGKIVNEIDLLDALNSGALAGYATDVLSDELEFDKGFKNHPLVEYSKKNNNLLIVPHIGGMTYESREATDIFIAEKLVKYLKSL